MNESKLDRLRAAGWKVGSAEEFLGLSREEVALIDAEVNLADRTRGLREDDGSAP